MRSFLVFCLLLAFGCMAQAQTVDRIEILEYGTYDAKITNVEAAPGSATGHRSDITEPVLISRTTTVSACLGVEFGLRYKILGYPEGAGIRLKKVTLVPPPGIRDPNTGNVRLRGEIIYPRHIGETNYIGWHFEDERELIPGTWMMEFWVGDRKLASQSFDVRDCLPKISLLLKRSPR
jgi:hypothetical protein